MQKPQLVTKYRGKMKFPVIVEPKYDGMRVLLRLENGVWQGYSRELKPVPGMPSLICPPTSGYAEGDVLDGEAEAIGVAPEFRWNETVKALKTIGGHPHIKCRFICFDLQLHANNKLPLTSRKTCLVNSFRYPDLEVGRFWFAKSEEEVQQLYQRCLAEGFEGVVVKKPSSYYTSARNTNWQRIKPCETIDMTITQWHEGTGQFQGMLGAVTAIGRLDDGTPIETKIGTGFSAEQREWTKAYLIGKVIEVEYQQITVKKALRGPAFKRLRLDKEGAL